MTAEPYEFSFEFLKQAARRIVNEVVGVSRVTYDITSKPPGMCMQTNILSQVFQLLIRLQEPSSWSDGNRGCERFSLIGC
jgi:hypothetical protein